jgi:2'-5' RNA ligase
MKAVDVVLLMPDNINQEMIAMNRSLDNNNRVIDFDKDGSHPHISLCMLVIDENELESVLNQIDEIAVDHNPIPISNERINTFKMDSL